MEEEVKISVKRVKPDSLRTWYYYYLLYISLFMKEDKKLTERECEILISFLVVEDRFVEGDRFNLVARSIVKKETKASSSYLTNTLKSLTEKGYLIKSETKKLHLNPELFSYKDKAMEFRLILNPVECLEKKSKTEA